MSTISNRNLLHLPDECLIDIFSYLSLFDLIHVHSTCKRFQAIFIEKYSKNVEKIEIKCNTITDYELILVTKYGNEQQVILRPDLDDLFKTCGIYIRTIILNENNESDLTETSEISSRRNHRYLLLLPSNSSIIHHINLLKNLKSLTINGFRKYELLPKIINSKLEEFYYNICYDEIPDLITFLQNNPNLKTLKTLQMSSLTTELLDYFKNIEKISINMGRLNDDKTETMTQVFQLQQLKQLELISYKSTEHLIKMIKDAVSHPELEIEVLALKLSSFRTVISLLNTYSFPFLKKLVLCNDFLLDGSADVDPDDISVIGDWLVNIEELHFIDFTRDFFNKFILQYVNYAIDVKTLVLLPKTARDIRSDDLCRLAEVQMIKRMKLRVEYENCLSRTIKMLEKTQSNGIAEEYLEFVNIRTYDYEFK